MAFNGVYWLAHLVYTTINVDATLSVYNNAEMLTPPKPRGRPPKPADQRLDAVLTTRVSSADQARIKAQADAEGVSVTAWLQRVVLAALPESAPE